MDIVKIQSLISQGKVVTLSDIDPTQSFVQVGIYQQGNRKIKSGDPNTYAPYVIPVSELGGGSNLPTNVGNLVINENGETQSTLVREYHNGFFVNNPFVTVTGTTEETIGAVLFVPANTFKVGDYFQEIALATCAINTDAASGDSFANIWYNSSPSLSGATLIESITFGYASIDMINIRVYGIKQGRKITSINGYSGGLDPASIPFSYVDNNAPMFDITQDNYLIISFRPQDPGCAFAITDFYLRKVLNAQIITP